MNAKKKDDFQVDTGGVSALLNGLSDRFGEEDRRHRTDAVTTADRHNGTTADSRDTRSKYTLLLDQDDALSLDELAIQMRRRTGRRVEKSEILRTLIRLAETNPPVFAALTKAFDRPPAQ
ncbi:hypothetical protein ACFRR7_36725 [Streptomyces sp. NPDC056909]|uniref:hypothetical protein n=1 Tax=Streptomyces sp. NPDC056909 TaxID=3345963 RepID=UPI003676C9CE